MREDEFEKRVREKMKQLGFSPSESVWTGVDREINKEKKRRAPLFWLFFASGLLLAGGAYYFITNKNTSETVAKISEKAGTTKKQNEEKAVASPEPQKNIEGTTNGKPANDAIGKSNQATHFVSPNSKSRKEVDYSGRSGLVIKETRADLPPTRIGQRLPREMRGSTSTIGETKQKNGSGLHSASAGTDEIVVSHYSDKSSKTEAEKINKTVYDSTAGKIVSAEKENKSKKDSAISSATAKNNEKKTKRSSWKWGYTGGIGTSNLNQNLLNSVKTLSPATFSANPTAIANVGYPNYSSSEINPGFSFEAGAFVSRNLSKRISFSAGINYHYYSTKMKTGMKINTTLVTVNDMNQTITANSYYENTRTQTFTNQYHLIEIPLTANFQLNKSKRMPFIWEIGLAPSYIISSNALYYDPNTNVYFSNYLQPNKMQLNGVTALMIGFPLYKGELQIGPQMQYGFTGFVHTNDGNPGHLFYAGLKISFIPGKK